MELAMEILSTEMVKPSKPTSPYLRFYKLSLLDQLFSLLEYSTPLVLFYNKLGHPSTSPTIDHLKQSLSKALSLYYPLAGRLNVAESTIDCNDKGAFLVVAQTNTNLVTYLSVPNRVEMLHRFLPRGDTFLDPKTMHVDGLIPLVFQFTSFTCGGFAIGAHPLNRTQDGVSWTNFLKTWAAISAGHLDNVLKLVPDFSTSLRLFPPTSSDHLSTDFSIPPVLQSLEDGVDDDYNNGNIRCIIKAFEFNKTSIAALQAKARSERVPNPSRIESVTCFLWKHFMEAAAKLHSSQSGGQDSTNNGQSSNLTSSTLVHSLDMRLHLRPPVPLTTFGKYVTHAFAFWEKKDGAKIELPSLVNVLRESLSKTKDVNYLSKFQGVGCLEAVRSHKKELEEQLDTSYFFTSLRGFDELDYGFGLPAWIGYMGGRPSSIFNNYIPLIQTPSHGIEAWLMLEEQQMDILVSNQEFLAFASPIGMYRGKARM